MLTSSFNFQDDIHTLLKFTPVVENNTAVGDEPFLTDYPKNILLSEDLELVPWMVGLTSSDEAFFINFYPNFFLGAGEPEFYIKNFK
jgi:hypothetical protein